jgi:hypothetical protein
MKLPEGNRPRPVLAGLLFSDTSKEQYAWYSRLPGLGLFLKRLKAKHLLDPEVEK